MCQRLAHTVHIDPRNTDNGAGHDKGPEGGHGVLLDGLQHARLLLCRLGLHGGGLVGLELGLIVEVVGVVDVGDALLGVGDLGGGAARLLDVRGLAHDGLVWAGAGERVGEAELAETLGFSGSGESWGKKEMGNRSIGQASALL